MFFVPGLCFEAALTARAVPAGHRPAVGGGPAVDVSLARLPLAALRDLVLGADPACLVDPVLFTGPDDDDEPADDRAVREAVAAQMCAECPARKPCLAYALLIRPEAGVWAGLAAAEVVALADAEGVPTVTAVA